MTSPALALPTSPSQYTFEPQLVQVRAMDSSYVKDQLRSDFVKSQIFTEQALNSGDNTALVAGLAQRLRMLRAVVERLPRHFIPYKQEPSYKLTYYIEKLSCGHERPYYPQAGPMSRRRFCTECAKASSLPPKKSCSEIVTRETYAEKQG